MGGTGLSEQQSGFRNPKPPVQNFGSAASREQETLGEHTLGLIPFPFLFFRDTAFKYWTSSRLVDVYILHGMVC